MGNLAGPLITEELFKAGQINANKFSFHFTIDDPLLNWVDMGEPDYASVRPGSNVFEMQVLDDFFWSTYNTGFAVGSIANGYYYEPSLFIDEINLTLDGVFTIVDTGASSINVCSLYYESIVRAIFDTSGVD